MKLVLPPCVEAILKLPKEEAERHLLVIGSYFKSYAKTPADVLSTVPNELIPPVWQIYTNPKTPFFSCDLVDTSFCDTSRCPLMVAEDPVSFLVNKISKAIYDVETRDITIWFENISDPLVFNVKEAYKTPAEVRSEIAVYTLEHFGSSIVLATVKDGDGNKINLLKEFVDKVYSLAVKIRSNDSLGIGELILDIINNHPVAQMETASINSEVFVYELNNEERYLAVEPRLFRTKARTRLGVTSNQKLSRILSRYNIRKKRIRIGGERGYFYLIPERVVEMFAGVGLDEIVNPNVEDVFVKIMGGNKGKENG